MSFLSYVKFPSSPCTFYPYYLISVISLTSLELSDLLHRLPYVIHTNFVAQIMQSLMFRLSSFGYLIKRMKFNPTVLEIWGNVLTWNGRYRNRNNCLKSSDWLGVFMTCGKNICRKQTTLNDWLVARCRAVPRLWKLWTKMDKVLSLITYLARTQETI